jgi:hypothetical protein
VRRRIAARRGGARGGSSSTIALAGIVATLVAAIASSWLTGHQQGVQQEKSIAAQDKLQRASLDAQKSATDVERRGLAKAIAVVFLEEYNSAARGLDAVLRTPDGGWKPWAAETDVPLADRKALAYVATVDEIASVALAQAKLRQVWPDGESGAPENWRQRALDACRYVSVAIVALRRVAEDGKRREPPACQRWR